MEVVAASRVESAGYLTKPQVAALMVISVFLSIDAPSAVVSTMVGGTVQKKVAAKAYEETSDTRAKGHVAV